MSYGLRVWDASGRMTLDVSDYLGRIVGQGVFSFAANEWTTKSITIPGLVSSDLVVVHNNTNSDLLRYHVSISGTTVSVQRQGSHQGMASSHTVVAIRI